jgi:hypothetical protein
MKAYSDFATFSFTVHITEETDDEEEKIIIIIVIVLSVIVVIFFGFYIYSVAKRKRVIDEQR